MNFLKYILTFFCCLLISVSQASTSPKYKNQDFITHRELDDLSSGAETDKDDLQGFSSTGYGYYSHPYLGGGYYGGYYPIFNGIYGLGYPYYGGYYGGYHGFHGHYW